MKNWRVGLGMIAAALLGTADASAGGAGGNGGFTSGPPVGFNGGFPGGAGGGMPGNFSGRCFGSMSGCFGTPTCGRPFGFSGPPAGMCGFGGCCGGMMTGIPGGCGGGMMIGVPGGCCGGMMTGIPGAGFTGCMPGAFCGGMIGMSGCCGGFMQPQPAPTITQFYTPWTKTPGRAYHHRSLFVYFPAPADKHQEFLLIHYPDRPADLYFFDPVQRQYFGKYRVGAKMDGCFSLIAAKNRRTHLREIPEVAYAPLAAMPTMQQLGILPASTASDSKMLAVQLRRPPSALPDEGSHLPPDEPLDKK